MFRFALVALAVAGWTAVDVRAQQGPSERPEFRLPPGVVMDADVEYGKAGDRSLKLDILRPKEPGGKPLPCVVNIHGGGWRAGSKEGARGTLAALAATGDYVGVTVGYRLTGEAIWPAQIHDCKAAIRFLRANAAKYHIDPQRIGAVGSSAGGHLVALLGTSGDVKELEGDNGSPGYSSRIQCVVDYCGPSNFLSFIGQKGDGGKGAVTMLFGGPPAEHAAAARAASPVTWASADDPPFMVVHGTHDGTVPFAQGEELKAALEKAGVSVTFIRIEGGGHGIGGRELYQRQRAFFDKHLRGQAVDVSADPIKAEPPPQP